MLVFEDAPNGARAGLSAGMKVRESTINTICSGADIPMVWSINDLYNINVKPNIDVKSIVMIYQIYVNTGLGKDKDSNNYERI